MPAIAASPRRPSQSHLAAAVLAAYVQEVLAR